MKVLVAMLVAAGFMGAVGVAQAGVQTTPAVPVNQPAQTAPLATSHNTPSSNNLQATTSPEIAGTQPAQHAALTHGQQMAIIGGVIGAAVLVLAASSGGGSHAASTPGTPGTTGTTGTTGTH